MIEQITRVANGRHHDPFVVLGFHREGGRSIIRDCLPGARQARVVEFGEMRRIADTDIWELEIDNGVCERPDYRIYWQDAAGNAYENRSPYAYDPLITDDDLHLFNEGKHLYAYRFLGAHLMQLGDTRGCRFTVWVPGVQRVSVVGEFNQWHGLAHQMRNRGGSGVWEIFIPGLHQFASYKYEILMTSGDVLHKSDPYARATALRPETVSLIPALQNHVWQDTKWMNERQIRDWRYAPMSIYEVHLGSWRRDAQGQFLTYRDFVDQLIPHVKYLGFTHIELLPIAEHPLDESWGYQVTNYYAPTSRFGSADELRYFIDQCHQADIGVLLDWVPAHFPKDEHALARFNGQALYEYTDPNKGEHRDWGTLVFDYGRHEVVSFLISNAIYWLEEFHFDGLRVDAVASMLYLDYSREDGQWTPNAFGGRENIEAIEFFKYFNEVIHERFPGAMTMAEESTAWPMVSRPTSIGGLGFSMKWNMGWMHDTLSYLSENPVNRKYHHDRLTFSQLYAYSENFILPLSHDEVVHLKGSLIAKMPGDEWQAFANLRLLLAYQFLHPGKKLLFMGAEMAQASEWNEGAALSWELNDIPPNNGIGRLIQDLNHLYRRSPALYQNEFDESGFSWIDCEDQQQSVLSFYRHAEQTESDGKDALICMFNFTPVPRTAYRIGLHAEGVYEVVLNTDSEYYAGSNTGNSWELESEPVAWHGSAQSVVVTLPPLAALVLKKVA